MTLESEHGGGAVLVGFEIALIVGLKVAGISRPVVGLETNRNGLFGIEHTLQRFLLGSRQELDHCLRKFIFL